MDNAALIQQSIMRDMNEGVMTIGLDGLISSVNPAAERILGMEADALLGSTFLSCFFEYPENDQFNQCILDAVYDSAGTHRNIVPYYTGTAFKQLQVTTSYLRHENRKIAVIAVISDISELAELRDAVKAMERIRSLNAQLELRNKLLSETFGRFLSDEIVRQLLDTPDGLALGGKKSGLTIMMSDLRGFTAISERMDAQSLIAMLNHYLGEMTDIIQRYNGTIIEFIGDGIMAIFGAPAHSENHAADAVAAAIAMEKRMEAVNAWNLERGYPRLETGIGINTGDVIVGNIGSEKRSKYGVVGSNVNLCGRIESYTVGGQVLISPQTRSMIKAPLGIAGEMKVSPKGVKEELTLSHVVSIGPPYDVSCTFEPQTDAMRPLRLPLSFRRISEKHRSAEDYPGLISAVSPKHALLECDEKLALFENLSFDIPCGEVSCKLVSLQEGAYLLRFTSLPEGFAAWLDNMTI